MRLFKKKDDSKSNTGGPPARNENPYAQAASENPYAQAPAGGNPYGGSQPSSNPYGNSGARGGAYAQARQHAYGGGMPGQQQQQQQQQPAPPAEGGMNNPYGSRNDSGPADNKYGGYAANKYGASGGYGSDRYGTSNQSQGQPQSRYGAGGYGGFGGASSNPYARQQEEDPNKNALFGNAAERAAQNKESAGGPPPYDSGSSTGDYRGTGGDYNPEPYNPGPKYDDRQLTAEEEEDEHVNAMKQEIRAVKQKDVSATRNALRMAQQAEEVGRDTLARLGVQAEYIHNTERNLDLAHNQNKQAEDKARELKTLNRSMFAVHVSNPFTAKSRDESRNAAVISRHEEERAEREATRREQFLAHQRMEKNFNDLSTSQSQTEQRQKNLAERSKYQFEADSEDEEMENEIDSNLHALSGVVGNMKKIAIATGQEVDSHNERLRRVHEKSDKVDIGIASNTARLNRIR